MAVDDATKAKLLELSNKMSIDQIEELENGVQKSRSALVRAKARCERNATYAEWQRIVRRLKSMQLDSVKTAISDALQVSFEKNVAEAFAEEFVGKVPQYTVRIASERFFPAYSHERLKQLPNLFADAFRASKMVKLTDGVASPSDVHLAFGALEVATRQVAPDAIVALNRGGRIVGEYLGRRLGNDSCILPFNITGDDESSGGLSENFKEKVPASARKIMIVDDISRSGNTITVAAKHLQSVFPYVEISTAALVCSSNSLQKLSSTGLFCPLQVPVSNVKLPYDSHGFFVVENDVNIFGSPGNNMSFTDHEAEYYFNEAIGEVIFSGSF
ncbi:phosphoribosyltransferase family protein [Roseibium sp. Sym1]|uniref:phosphoribosyltransferase family protein n=1 Tax=Roseibium sp. Sym1 TaxID=3016006 RepID=UPI0022B3D76F|nr:phosphoribosyltransferase family protein [Roseibium sp. Sym1]